MSISPLKFQFQQQLHQHIRKHHKDKWRKNLLGCSYSLQFTMKLLFFICVLFVLPETANCTCKQKGQPCSHGNCCAKLQCFDYLLKPRACAPASQSLTVMSYRDERNLYRNLYHRDYDIAEMIEELDDKW